MPYKQKTIASIHKKIIKEWIALGHEDKYLPQKSMGNYEFSDFANFYDKRKTILKEKLESILLQTVARTTTRTSLSTILRTKPRTAQKSCEDLIKSHKTIDFCHQKC